MKRIISYIFGRKRIIIFTFAMFLIYGIYSYIIIPKQEMPTIQTPYMLIEVLAPGESATSMSENVIDGIEENITAFSNVTSVESTSYNSYSYIEVLFGYDTDDPDKLALEIFNKISELSLHPSIESLTYSSNYKDPHIIFAVHSDSLLENELEVIAEDFKNDLLAYDAISGVDIDVPYNEELKITLDNDIIQSYNLSLADIYQIIYANTLNIPLGQFTTESGTITIEGTNVISSIDDLQNLIIIPSNDVLPAPVLLSDISIIEVVPSTSKAYYYNSDDAIFVSVYFEENIDFTKEGDAILQIKEAFLDETSNVSINEMLFLPDDVESQINSVFVSLLIAIGIVLIIVLIGIGVRNSLLIVATIPSIVFGTIAILSLSNFQLHKLTIVGLIISIGIMVDNQIVITEGIKKNIDHGQEKAAAAIKAIMDNLGPILSSTLTTIAAFVTLALLPGFLGLVVSSMPITVIITISLSFIVSITLSPVLSTLLLKKTKQKIKNDIHETRIKNMIRFTIKTPLLWIILSILLLVGSSYFAFTKQPVNLYPSDNKSAFYVDYNSGDENPKAFHDNIIEALNNDTHVENTSSSIGGNIPLFHFSALYIAEQPNYGRIYVNTTFSEKEMINYIKTLENELSTNSTQEITFHQLKLSPPVAPLQVIISGENITTVSVFSDQLSNALSSDDTIETIRSKNNIIAPEFVINYDLDAIQNSYLTKAEIDAQIATSINGYETTLYLGDDTYKTTIKTNYETMDQILLDTIKSDITNVSYPLSTFVSYQVVNDYQVIHHYNNQASSVIDLYFSDDSSLASLEDTVKSEVATLDTSGITVKYGGENDMFEEILSDLIRASVIAIVLIYIIMLVQFNHFLKPLIVFVTIPLSFTGSFLFLLLFNTPITATALVGMVSLIGVTVNTGILLVEYIARSENTMSLDEACANAVYERFRPIMLTSATTILGLIPLYITGGNFFSPLAITFMGGMVTSTIISIFLVPSLYKLFFRKKW